jgi:Ca2+-binding RTX toxin-like protein
LSASRFENKLVYIEQIAWVAIAIAPSPQQKGATKMSSVIKGTQFDDNNTVNGNGKFHKSLVGENWTRNDKGQIQFANDTIYGDKGNDKLVGRAGDDILYGGDDSDQLNGDAGRDKLYGEFGEDFLYGGSGDDILYGGFAGDKLMGDAHNDKLDGEAGEDFLYGGSGKDTLSGGLHNDHLFGGSGKDYLIGGDGSDYLDGANFYGAGNGIGTGSESDSLAGGEGTDTFVLGNINNVYYLGTGHASITDFTLGTDKIQIKGQVGDGYTLKAKDWSGNEVLDTGIYYKGNLIGVVLETNLTNVNPNKVFSSAPSIPI